ncbi:protein DETOXIFICATION 21-like [Salvia miltiorrhiza]|uniref:protein DETOXIFICATION 21-like n=1 Tax=Salvia miltiorrhiza TaxID=226208 RepID=UPI0025AC9C8E|nr:protein DETOXIFICATION 21-like [Salvia miltiorrhiza]XP_057767373.1 protein DETOXIFICATION 21-like [Salvia miltiorrhiza]XP_057767374.1 protein DETOXIFICATION 21-like [Salvia miltiorrhiza]
MEPEMKEKLLQVAENNEENLKKKIWNETKKMWIIAGPAILIRFSTFGINVVSQAFVGHIGATELAAYALVYTVLLRFSNGILIGMNSGFGTLHGQAYGAKQYQNLGMYLQQGWIVLPTVAAILCPLLVFAAPILKALGQDELVAETAGVVALWFIPLTFSFAVLCASNMFLQSQSKIVVLSCLSTLSLLLHIFISWLLTVRFEFGMTGAMVSTTLAYWIPNVGQIIYIFCGGCRETWGGFTALAFKDLGHTIKIAASSCLMFSLELWYNAVLIVLSGNMENAEVSVDALSICLNMSGWAQMISTGLMATTSVRVANELGRGNARAAKFAIAMILVTLFSIALLVFALFLVFREQLAYAFTTSEDVAAVVANLSPLLAYSLLLNGLQPILSGVAAGAGRQSTVTYVNLASYYLIGIPLAVILGFPLNFQVQGVWIGMIIGSTVQTGILVVMTCTTDWNEQIFLAHKRISRPLTS